MAASLTQRQAGAPSIEPTTVLDLVHPKLGRIRALSALLREMIAEASADLDQAEAGIRDSDLDGWLAQEARDYISRARRQLAASKPAGYHHQLEVR